MQELKNKEAAVVVFSGGQDSTTDAGQLDRPL